MDPILTPVVTRVLTEALKIGVRGLASSSEWIMHKGREAAAVSRAAKAYADLLERRHNVIKILGMDKPIALRDVYVRVNILDKIRSYMRVSISSLEQQFDFDRRSFGTARGTWDGSEIVLKENYAIKPNVVAALERLLALESDRSPDSQLGDAAVARLANRSYRGAQAMLKDLARETGSDVVRQRATDLGAIALQPPTNYIVLGKPGAGKSTFLKYLTLLMLDGQPEVSRIPIFVSLKDYADVGAELIPYMSQDFASCGLPEAEQWLRTMLESGKCVVLLDGLDEVPVDTQDRVLNQTLSLSDDYFKCRCIVSCRIAAYNHWFTKFTDLEIADFSEAQVRSFVKNWFAGEPTAAKSCLLKINASRQTRELATTPLLLTLLCLAYDQTLGISFEQS